jgi:hypothetical protein
MVTLKPWMKHSRSVSGIEEAEQRLIVYIMTGISFEQYWT